MKKIFVRISGGIGNQLFQIVNSHNFAAKKNYELFYYLDENDPYKRNFYLKSLCNNLNLKQINRNEIARLPLLNDLTFFNDNQYFNEDYLKPPYRIEASLQNWHLFYSDRSFYRNIIISSIKEDRPNININSLDNLFI